MLDTVKTTKLVLDKNERIAELEEENKELRKQKGELRQRLNKLQEYQDKLIWVKENKELLKENKKLKSEIENMKEVGRENIETLDRMSIELENYSKSFKKYRDFEKQELADSLYDMEEYNKKLKEKIEKLEKELSAVYKAYHTAMGVDYNNEEDLYTIEDIEGHNAE